MTAESPALTAVIDGVPGIVKGTTALDFGLSGEVPFALTAATVNAYDEPAVRPLMTRVVVLAS